MIPKIVQVVPTKNYKVYVYFEDGKIVLYDVSHLLEKGIFEKLKDIDFFTENCTVMNDTLAWDVTGNRDTTQCIDIDPCMLYDLPAVKESLNVG